MSVTQRRKRKIALVVVTSLLLIYTFVASATYTINLGIKSYVGFMDRNEAQNECIRIKVSEGVERRNIIRHEYSCLVIKEY